MRARHTLRRWGCLAAASLALSGCASVTPEAAFTPVADAARAHLGAPGAALAWPRGGAATDAAAEERRQRVAALLSQPLDADAAVELALRHNPGLQASFEALGVQVAERVQAARLPNPGLSLGRLRQGDETEWEQGLHLSLSALLTWPQRRAVAEQRLLQAQARATLQTLTLAADTRKAWVQAVAAQESLRYARQVLAAAEAGAELARRMAQVGNFSRLQRAREQTFEAEAQLGVAQAELARVATRERLVRLLGLWGDDAARLTLPDRLPDLPAAPADQPALEREAMAQRLDVREAVARVDETAREAGLTRVTRWVDGLELGASRARSNEGPPQRGWELSVTLPLFDLGDARSARAAALHRQALQAAADVAVQARSQVREAYLGYRTRYDIARHHQEALVPLRRTVSDENLLRYNGMLIGVFELLADARAQIAGVNAAIEARRDFFLAQADLAMAMVGSPTPSATTGALLNAGPAAGADH